MTTEARITRRTLTGLAGTAALGALGMGSAQAATRLLIARPVTPTRGAVFVAGVGDGAVTVSTTAGRVLASGKTSGGAVMLSFPMSAGVAQTLVVRSSAGASLVGISTSAAAVAASPWRVANKRIALPSNFTPSALVPIHNTRLRSEVVAAYNSLARGAAAAGSRMADSSGYRPYASQATLYNSFVRQLGRAGADRVCARPGHSEHQLGNSLDVKRSDGYCAGRTCFASTGLGMWLAANSYRYGFIRRYESDQTQITGFSWESWHLRYLGGPVALDYHRRGYRALETYFGLPAAPNY